MCALNTPTLVNHKLCTPQLSFNRMVYRHKHVVVVFLPIYLPKVVFKNPSLLSVYFILCKHGIFTEQPSATASWASPLLQNVREDDVLWINYSNKATFGNKSRKVRTLKVKGNYFNFPPYEAPTRTFFWQCLWLGHPQKQKIKGEKKQQLRG